MNYILARNWWSLAIRGIAGILFGIIAFAWPGITLGGLVLLFGVYALIDGIAAIAGAVRAVERHDRWGALLLEGVAGLLAAIAAGLWPAITVLVLVYLVAAWAFVTGIAEIAAAIHLHRQIRGEWLLAGAGVISILFGILLAIAPLIGAFVIALWIGAYAFVFGVVLLVLAVRLRRMRGRPPHQMVPPRAA